MTASTLAPFKTAGAIIAAYQSTCAVIRSTYAELVIAEAGLNLALSSSGAYHEGGIKICADRNYQSQFDQPDETIKRLRRGVWDQLLVKLELRKFLSVRAWRDVQKQVEDDAMPDITEETVGSFVQGLLDQRGEIMADAVAEVFEFLRPHRDVYKTNSQFEIGPRVVLTWMVESRCGGGRQLRYDRRQQVLAMERVFQALDGRGEISREHYSELENAIKLADVGETTWFRYRACKNGNLHVEFRRRDLLAKFNRIAGGKRLRPDTRRSSAGSEIERAS